MHSQLNGVNMKPASSSLLLQRWCVLQFNWNVGLLSSSKITIQSPPCSFVTAKAPTVFKITQKELNQMTSISSTCRRPWLVSLLSWPLVLHSWCLSDFSTPWKTLQHTDVSSNHLERSYWVTNQHYVTLETQSNYVGADEMKGDWYRRWDLMSASSETQNALLHPCHYGRRDLHSSADRRQCFNLCLAMESIIFPFQPNRLLSEDLFRLIVYSTETGLST